MALLTLELINKTLIGTCQVLGSKLRAFIYWFVFCDTLNSNKTSFQLSTADWAPV